ncbi:MAG: hypothetical protein DMG58_10300 [Acidobacteria bacterium]|nr:MAG: hypothetical protein DMG58_10300 [Acidobacteriota bacterium]
MKVGNLEITLTDEELKAGYHLAETSGVGSITTARLLVALANRIDRLQKIVGLGQAEPYLDGLAKEHVELARVQHTSLEVRS